MKTRLLCLVLFANMPMLSFAKDTSLDVPILVSKRADIFQRILSLRVLLSQDDAINFEMAVQRLSLNCDHAVSAGINSTERDALFVSLVNEHTPRQIILIAALLALTESASLAVAHPPNPTNSEAMAKYEDLGQIEYYSRARSEGVGFVRLYARFDSK